MEKAPLSYSEAKEAVSTLGLNSLKVEMVAGSLNFAAVSGELLFTRIRWTRLLIPDKNSPSEVLNAVRKEKGRWT